MLRVRILTAAILASVFVFGVFALSGLYFASLIGLFVLLGAWEWTHLSGYSALSLKMAAVATALLLMVLGYLYGGAVSADLLSVTCAGWLVVAVLLFRRRNGAPMPWPRVLRWLSGVWVLLPAWLAISVLQRRDPGAALMLFVLVWAADTGAYFVGRQWGRRKLAPGISPGKTMEGLGGALAVSLVVAAGFGTYWGLGPARWLALAGWSLMVVVMSVVGDLFESNWKRTAELKDSGGVLPGHGGVLDRIDSMTAAAPFFALGWLWWFGSAGA